MSIQLIVTIFLYLVSALMLGIRTYSVISCINKFRSLALGLAASALLLHGHLLYQSIILTNGLDFGLFNAVSLISWLVVFIVLSLSLFRPLESLLLLLLPVTACVIIIESIFPDTHIIDQSLSLGLRIHILLSISAYSLLMISAVQAIMLAVQESMIKKKRTVKIIYALPPLKVMEDLLVQIIVIGFFLLSLSLASGMMFIQDIFGQHLIHKTVLSIMAWFIYSILLWGRWALGWRGQRIIRWTLIAFTILLMAYIGSKFVLEIILQHV